MRKLSAVERWKSANLYGAQLVAVLERLTLALKSPEQQEIGSEAEQFAGVLEGVTRALKATGQKTGGNEVSQDTRILEEPRAAESTSERKANATRALPAETNSGTRESE